MSTYKCEKCEKTYKKVNNEKWNDFKAAEEYLDFYPEGKNDATGMLCDDCNEEFKKWFSSLTSAQKNQMRKEYEENK